MSKNDLEYLIEQAKKLGVSLKFESGLNVLRKTASVDPELIKSLTKYLPEVRFISQRYAVFALAKRHVGARIFSKEHGEGALTAASEDGTLTIAVGAEMRRSDEYDTRRAHLSITANAESVLIILEGEGAEADSPPADQKLEVERPRKRLFGLI